MISHLVLFSLMLGAIMGSFLLVVSLRFNTGKSLKGRSQCFSCHKKLSWSELIPIFSYLAQKGRCKSCSSRIPSETLIAEALTASVFTLIMLRALFVGASTQVLLTTPYLIGTFFLFVTFSILIVIFFYDIHHKIIPDSLSFSFGFLTLVSAFFFDFVNGVFIYQGFHIPETSTVFAGVLLPLPFILIWLFSKGRMMGLGDPKLMVGMGFLFGLSGGISSVFVSFWLGTLVIISLVITQKVLNKKLFGVAKGGIMKQEIPFGPFLILGTLVTLLFNIRLF